MDFSGYIEERLKQVRDFGFFDSHPEVTEEEFKKGLEEVAKNRVAAAMKFYEEHKEWSDSNIPEGEKRDEDIRGWVLRGIQRYPFKHVMLPTDENGFVEIEFPEDGQ